MCSWFNSSDQSVINCRTSFRKLLWNNNVHYQIGYEILIYFHVNNKMYISHLWRWFWDIMSPCHLTRMLFWHKYILYIDYQIPIITNRLLIIESQNLTKSGFLDLVFYEWDAQMINYFHLHHESILLQPRTHKS